MYNLEVIELGLSRKWPEDPEAVRRIRAAFNIHIAKAILEKYDLQTQAYTDHINVFKEGFVFRLRVVYPREVVLLKECKTPDGKDDATATLQNLSSWRSTLCTCLSSLESVAWAAAAVALVWVCGVSSGQEMALLPAAGQCPRTGRCHRAAGRFAVPLSRAIPSARAATAHVPAVPATCSHTPNFHLEPVIVNFNGNLKSESERTLIEIESHFRQRANCTAPLYIATQYDKSGSVWTREAPTLPVLVRLASLASQSLTVLETNFLSSALYHICKGRVPSTARALRCSDTTEAHATVTSQPGSRLHSKNPCPGQGA
ncbi:nucleolar protein 6-like [Homalodisca vitripennis]|uniref:nucleolar protein 6-like n=1 Tax=Homalodisca vitripennis TaxID=197043 RepID=UPI001EEBB2AD|nr:nucleolar protein 6-like [Homalodisca vitripennis]